MRTADNNGSRAVAERDEGADGSDAPLIDRVVDPISWLMEFCFREDWNWHIANTAPDSQQFEFRPTIPFKAWDQENLLRLIIPCGRNCPWELNLITSPTCGVRKCNSSPSAVQLSRPIRAVPVGQFLSVRRCLCPGPTTNFAELFLAVA